MDRDGFFSVLVMLLAVAVLVVEDAFVEGIPSSCLICVTPRSDGAFVACCRGGCADVDGEEETVLYMITVGKLG